MKIDPYPVLLLLEESEKLRVDISHEARLNACAYSLEQYKLSVGS